MLLFSCTREFAWIRVVLDTLNDNANLGLSDEVQHIFRKQFRSRMEKAFVHHGLQYAIEVASVSRGMIVESINSGGAFNPDESVQTTILPPKSKI
jgi:hypothetical protein